MPETPHPTSAILLTALRTENSRAVREFVTRMTPLLRKSGRRLGVEHSEMRDLTVSVLDDVMWHLMRNRRVNPRDIEAYVVVAFRNTVRDEARSARARERELEVSLEAIGSSVIAAVMADVDEMSAPEEIEPDQAMELFRTIYRGAIVDLSQQEQELLGHMVNRAKARSVASWMGIGVPAVRVRIHRLRSRIRADVLRRVAELPAEQRDAVGRILHRRGIIAEPESAAGDQADENTTSERDRREGA